MEILSNFNFILTQGLFGFGFYDGKSPKHRDSCNIYLPFPKYRDRNNLGRHAEVVTILPIYNIPQLESLEKFDRITSKKLKTVEKFRFINWL